MSSDRIRLFFAGDVMTGRGIDQILSHPSEPTLHERAVRDARDYVRLAEQANGRIEDPVDPEYIWGDLPAVLDEVGTAGRIVNLETSVTISDEHWPGKGIHYRMHPANVACLTSAGIDCCCLANNHVVDWGYEGLKETMHTLDGASLGRAGAGGDANEAAAPAVIELPGRERVLVFAYGTPSSGIPPEWRAGWAQPGVSLLGELTEESARNVGRRVGDIRRSGDTVVVSIHWGGNWGYDVPHEHVHFAHRLVDQGVDLVHGHSSHHPMALEVYRERLIMYGCGDLINDYEGIGGRERFRGELSLAYLAELEPGTGRLLEARAAPFRTARMRLNRASVQDSGWLSELVNRLGARFNTRARLDDDGLLTLRWS